MGQLGGKQASREADVDRAHKKAHQEEAARQRAQRKWERDAPKRRLEERKAELHRQARERREVAFLAEVARRGGPEMLALKQEAQMGPHAESRKVGAAKMLKALGLTPTQIHALATTGELGGEQDAES